MIDINNFGSLWSVIEIKKNIWTKFLEEDLIKIITNNNFKVIKKIIEIDYIKLVLEKI